MVEFNLQTFLSDMRSEHKEDCAAILQEMKMGFSGVHARASSIAEDLSEHTLADVRIAADTSQRFDRIEVFIRSAKWVVAAVAGAVIVGLVGAAFDVLANHWK